MATPITHRPTPLPGGPLGMMVELHPTRCRVVLSPWAAFWTAVELLLCAFLASSGCGPQGIRHAFLGRRPHVHLVVSPRQNRRRAFETGRWVPSDPWSPVWFRLTSDALRQEVRRNLDTYKRQAAPPAINHQAAPPTRPERP